MVTLLLGASTLVVGAMGWYGYWAVCRIQEWGRGMNQIDRIFQIAGEQAELELFPTKVTRVVAARPIGGFAAGRPVLK